MAEMSFTCLVYFWYSTRCVSTFAWVYFLGVSHSVSLHSWPLLWQLTGPRFNQLHLQLGDPFRTLEGYSSPRVKVMFYR